MISSFLIALREGAEAALVVGIVFVYLDRTGRSRLARFVWAGVALAAALSLASAIALERWQISEDGFEGLLMLLAAVFVVTMIVWMNRVARHLRKQIEERVELFAQKTDLAAGLGLGADLASRGAFDRRSSGLDRYGTRAGARHCRRFLLL